MTDATEPQRLDTLAALLEADPDASREADAWVRADGSAADVSLIDAATPQEWDLAAAVRGDAMNDADVNAIVALLRLANGSAMAGALKIALTQTFIDGGPLDHAAAFADAYRRLALPGLRGDEAQRASALINHLS